MSVFDRDDARLRAGRPQGGSGASQPGTPVQHLLRGLAQNRQTFGHATRHFLVQPGRCRRRLHAPLLMGQRGRVDNQTARRSRARSHPTPT